MSPSIELHYRLTDECFTRLLETADGPVSRTHRVLIRREDHPAAWPTLVRLLPFSGEGHAVLAAGDPITGEAYTGILDADIEAETVWSPHEAAQALISWLNPMIELSKEIHQLRRGRLPGWLPREVVDQRAWSDTAQSYVIRHYEQVLRSAQRELFPGIAKSLLEITTSDITFSEPFWPRALVAPLSLPLRRIIREQAVLTAGFQRPRTIADHLKLGHVIRARALRSELKLVTGFELSVKLSDTVRQRLEHAAEALEASVRADQEAWITAHGSDRLRRIVKEGLLQTSLAVYLHERLAHDRPGWTWTIITVDGLQQDLANLLDTPRDVPLYALQLLDRAREFETGAELRYLQLEHEDHAFSGHVVSGTFLERDILMVDDELATAIAALNGAPPAPQSHPTRPSPPQRTTDA